MWNENYRLLSLRRSRYAFSRDENVKYLVPQSCRGRPINLLVARRRTNETGAVPQFVDGRVSGSTPVTIILIMDIK